MVLSELDERTVAIEFKLNQVLRVIRGIARYRTDEVEIGPYLSVEVDDDEGDQGRPELLIPEESWSGRIERDTKYGCDFRLKMSHVSEPNVA